MHKQLLICLLICLKGAGVAQAQWTAKDSLWLQNVLAGKDSLRLNPETMRAIQSGTFLNWETPSTPMLTNPAKLSIVKDFSEYIQQEDTLMQRLLRELPAYAFIRRAWKDPKKPDTRYEISPAAFRYLKGYWLDESAIDNTGRVESWDRGNADFAHTLNMLLSREYRQHYNNSLVAAVSLKAYKEAPTPEMVKKMNRYQEQQRALPFPFVTHRDSIAKRDSIKQDSLLVVRDSLWVISDSTLVLPRPTNQSWHGPDSLSSAVPADSVAYRRLPN